MFMRVLQFVFAILVVILVVLVYLSANRQKNSEVSQSNGSVAFKICNAAPKELRFSCYRKLIAEFYKRTEPNNLEDFVKKLEELNALTFKSEDSSYAIFGTNCHTFYHALGDFIATYADNLGIEETIRYCPLTCTSGCTMGLFKRSALANRFSTDLLKRFYGVCRGTEFNQCAHEVGHLLHDKYTTSVLKTLDQLTKKHYGYTYPDQYQYVTFPKANLDRPFEECREIFQDADNLIRQCYTGLGHNLFLYSEFNQQGYKSQFDECAKTSKANRENCFGFFLFRIGIQDGATKFLTKAFEEGKIVCNEAVGMIGREELKFHCYRGIGGGIGLFIESEYAKDPTTEATIGQVQEEVLSYAKLCENSEEAFINECFSGLLGTHFKTLYQDLELRYEPLDRLLKKLKDDSFQVVG